MLEKSFCSTAPIAGVPDWIHLLPLGDIQSGDGRSWKNDAPEAVVAATHALDRELAVDFEHSIDLKKGGPAAGWMSAFELRSDGIYGRVQWTEAGRKAIAGREYRFISPVFMHKKTGEITHIIRAGLTNNPAIAELKAVASRRGSDGAGGDLLSAQEREICRRMGLGEGDYLRTKRGFR